MSSDWPSWCVTDLEAAGILLVQDGNHGEYRPRREELVPDGTPHIRAADITDSGTVAFDGAQRINDVALARIRKGIGASGDVLLTHKGTVGRVARVPANAPHFVCSPQTTFWRSLDPNRLDQTFLFAYLRSAPFAEQLRVRMHETDMAPYVSLTAQRSFVLPLPPIAEQRGIAAVLGTFDDKIDCNRRLIPLLRDLIDARFRAAAKDQQGLPLADLATMIKRGITPRYTEDGGVLVVNQKCIRNRSIAFGDSRRHDVNARAVAADRMLRPHDVVVNSTGVGTLGRVATVRWLPEPSTVDSHVTVVRPAPDAIEPEYLAHELMIRQPELEALGEGSTGQTELSRTRLGALSVRAPSRREQLAFVEFATPMVNHIAALERESLNLTALRNAILPKLISWQIRVPDTADPAEVVEPAAEAIAAVS